jgi:chromosome segregation ATPase
MPEAISNQGELLLAIGRLEGKMDSLLQSYENLEADMKDLSRRVNTLEKERSRLYGAGFVLAVLGSGIMWVIATFKGN